MNLPDKFTFTVQKHQYTACKQHEGYQVTWPTCSEGVFYRLEQVIRSVQKNIWRDIKEVKQPSFSIKEGNIEKAAQFIIANNKYMANKTVNYITFSIKDTIRRQIERIKNNEEAWYCATAGYTVFIFQEDEDYYVVEVLVDPSVTSDAEFVNVEDML